jgi:hypothetical protein
MKPLEWEQRQTTDDHGTRDRPAMIETVWVAYDRDGYEWMVAPHDDGTWNWFRCDPEGNPVIGETDHKTSESALQGANARAELVLK